MFECVAIIFLKYLVVWMCSSQSHSWHTYTPYKMTYTEYCCHIVIPVVHLKLCYIRILLWKQSKNSCDLLYLDALGLVNPVTFSKDLPDAVKQSFYRIIAVNRLLTGRVLEAELDLQDPETVLLMLVYYHAVLLEYKLRRLRLTVVRNVRYRCRSE